MALAATAAAAKESISIKKVIIITAFLLNVGKAAGWMTHY